MAALADPAPNQRNGQLKAPAAPSATAPAVDAESITSEVAVPEANSTPPLSTTNPNAAAATANPSTANPAATPKKAAGSASGKAAKKPLDPSEVRTVYGGSCCCLPVQPVEGSEG